MESHPAETLLAWRIFQAIEKLSSLLFDHYEQAFMALDLEEEGYARRAPASFDLPGADDAEPSLESVSLPSSPREEG